MSVKIGCILIGCILINFLYIYQRIWSLSGHNWIYLLWLKVKSLFLVKSEPYSSQKDDLLYRLTSIANYLTLKYTAIFWKLLDAELLLEMLCLTGLFQISWCQTCLQFLACNERKIVDIRYYLSRTGTKLFRRLISYIKLKPTNRDLALCHFRSLNNYPRKEIAW